MNTVKEISTLITNKKHLFQVSIPGTHFSHGKTTVDMALSDSESVEAYLNKIARANKAEHLFVKLFSPNGSSFKPRGEHLIFLEKQQPVATPTIVATPVAKTATVIVEEPKPHFNGFQLATQSKKNTPDMDQKDYIDFKVLQSEHKRLEHTCDEYKDRNKKLEAKIEDLHEENKKLLRDNLTKEDKHELALERTKLQIERDSKDGLSGIVDFANNNPETVKMLIGLVKPDHPMFKVDNQPALEGADNSIRNIKYTDDSEANDVLNDIPRSLSQKDGDTIAAVYLLFKKFIAEPDVLKQAVTTFIPEYTNTTN